RYSGNPLALKLVADTRDEIFGGDLTALLADESLIFDDIRAVLDQHFARLTDLEQQILFWLAVEREATPPALLRANLVEPPPQRIFIETLRNLQRRSLVERQEAGFALQNVVTEYLTDRLIEVVYRELTTGEFKRLHQQALLKAQAKEYVRESQARVILQPVTEQLIARSGRDGLLQKVRSYPDRLRAAQLHGYAAGNLLNWLLYVEGELVNLDLSGLTIQQAYLRGKIIHDLDLRGAAFKTTVFTETFDILRCLAFSPDGTLLVVGTDDGQLCFWQTHDWLLIQRWHISHDTIRSVAFSQDGHTLASADMGGQIQLWDLLNLSQANQPQPRLAFERLPSPVWSICFSPDGQTLASGTLDQSLRLWNVATGEMIRILQHDLLDGVGGVCFRPETEGHPRMLASSSYKTVFLWDVDSGEAVQILQGHTDYIWSVCFSPDGNTLASCCSDGTIRLWDTTTWQTRQILTGHTGRVIAMCFSPDGRILASGSSHGTIRLWAANSGQALQILRGHTNWAAALCFSPDGRTLVSVSGDQSIRLWDMSAASTLSEAEGLTTSMSTPDELVSSHPLQTFQGYRRGIRSISFSPDGETVASGGTDGIIRLWDVNDDGAEPRQALIGHQILVTAVCFSPDGHTLASADLRGFLHLWNLAQPANIVGQSERIAPTVLAQSFSPDRHFLAIGETSHLISIWDLATRQVSHTLTGHNETITALAFNPDGKILASANADPTILLWDISAISTLSEVEDPNTSEASSQIIRRFQEPGRVWSVAFSPDGLTLASGGDAGIIYLWDISTASTRSDAAGLNTSVAGESDQPRQRLAGHGAGISSVAFSPNGRLLVSGGIDRSLRLWDIASGKTIHTLTGHTERVWSVCFSPDGQMVASGSDDGAVKFWDVTTGRCLSTRRP
ncbi:MAG: hypothetical protein KDE31_21010, partial [Caldilineaceae bacterium]|nr:hypothetical protein [Caldilineaceae bacterium]